jgi:hypothetical protein
MNVRIERRRDKSPGKSGSLETTGRQVAISVVQRSTFQILPPGVGQIAGVVRNIFENFEYFGKSWGDWDELSRVMIGGKIAGASRYSPLSGRLRPDREKLRRDASATVWSGTLQPLF